MLASNVSGVEAGSKTETTVCEWTSDGEQFVLGYTGTGSYSAYFRLYVNEEEGYIYQTSPSNRTAYVVDRAFKIPAGQNVRLTVYHESVDIQTFYGTILGGGY
jgi:hypothetical protein